VNPEGAGQVIGSMLRCLCASPIYVGNGISGSDRPRRMSEEIQVGKMEQALEIPDMVWLSGPVLQVLVIIIQNFRMDRRRRRLETIM
jgi:hypothetical protein